MSRFPSRSVVQLPIPSRTRAIASASQTSKDDRVNVNFLLDKYKQFIDKQQLLVKETRHTNISTKPSASFIHIPSATPMGSFHFVKAVPQTLNINTKFRSSDSNTVSKHPPTKTNKKQVDSKDFQKGNKSPIEDNN